MKKLLILGAALLGLCAVGQTARAGGDEPEYRNDREYRDYSRNDDCPPPRSYEGRVVERHYLLPPPPLPAFLPPPPLPFFYTRSYYHHRHYRPYGYGYGYRPGIHIGIGF